MILAAVDDLMFTSKIRTTARQLGLAITFTRSPEQLIEQARTSAPRLIILDLNSTRCRPLESLETLKGDPNLAAVPTVGFASHVQTDVIEAARRAGADEVLPRSAFTAQLPDILERGR